MIQIDRIIKLIIIVLLSLTSSCNPASQKRTELVSDVISTGKGLLEVWPEEGPELIWMCKGLGRGYGGPYVTNEGIFIGAEENGKSLAVRIDHSGNIKWKSSNGKEFMGTGFTASYPGTRSIPTVLEGKVYAVSGTGHISCFDVRNGNVIWTADIIKDYEGILGDFGYSESPVVDNKRVYCFPGGKVHNIIALDKQTGELVWSSPVHKDYCSYGTPILLDLPEKNVLVGTSRNYIYVLDRKDGTLLSSYQLEDISEGNEHCNSVIHQKGYIYFVPSEENGQGSIKLRISPDGESLNEVWRNRKVINVFEGFIVLDKWLFTTLENKKLISVDTNKGKVRSSVRAVFGNIVYADNKLFLYGHNGTVQLFSLESGKPELKSEMRIKYGDGHHFSFPVVAEGVMYIRHGDVLMAYAVK